MGAIAGDELVKWEKMQGMSGREEKILVLIRLRPLSEKETAVNEVADWECINDTTILYRNTLREGSTFPSAYTFGKKCPSLMLLYYLQICIMIKPESHYFMFTLYWQEMGSQNMGLKHTHIYLYMENKV